MNVLSLFDGMSCGQLALERAGFKVDKYFASEVDKYAIQVTMANFPNTIQLGDVQTINPEDLPEIDLLIGGSPCQGFSFAGKRKGSVTKCNIEVTTLNQYLILKQEGFEFQGQSYLFWEYMRLLKALKPKYFLLENVKMNKKWQVMFNDAIGVEPIEINSALVSAQNRKRLYWTNIPGVTQPADKGIMLKDILEDGEVDLSYASDGSNYRGGNQLNANYKSQANTIHDPEGKSATLCAGTHGYANGHVPANYFKGGNLKQYFEKHRRQLVFSKDGLCHVGDADIKSSDSIKRVYHPDGKSNTLTTCTGGHREPKVLIVPEATKKGHTEIFPGQCVDLTYPTSKTRRGRKMEYKSNYLTATNYQYGKWDGYQWRKLTPIECERLQTVPDNYTNHVSNTQRYKMLGNGWTVDVIVHILRHIRNEDE